MPLPTLSAAFKCYQSRRDTGGEGKPNGKQHKVLTPQGLTLTLTFPAHSISIMQAAIGLWDVFIALQVHTAVAILPRTLFHSCHLLQKRP